MAVKDSSKSRIRPPTSVRVSCCLEHNSSGLIVYSSHVAFSCSRGTSFSPRAPRDRALCTARRCPFAGWWTDATDSRLEARLERRVQRRRRFFARQDKVDLRYWRQRLGQSRNRKLHRSLRQRWNSEWQLAHHRAERKNHPSG